MRNEQTMRARGGRVWVVLAALTAILLLPRAGRAQDMAPDATAAKPAPPTPEERKPQDHGDAPPPAYAAPAPRVPDVRKPRGPQSSDDEPPAARQSALGQAPVAATAPSNGYGGQIALADLGALVVGGVLSSATHSADPVVLMWLFASPVVHAVHGNPGRGAVSLILHVGMPIVGGILGYETEGCSSNRSQDDGLCGLGGAVLGFGMGMLAATMIDAFGLAEMRDQPPRTLASTGIATSAPALSVGRNGDVNVGWRGTF